VADLPPDRDTNPDDPAAGTARAPAPGTPRWVLGLGIIAVVLIVAFVVQAVLGGGHGPQMHAPSSDAGGQADSSSPSEGTADVGGPADAAHAARTVEVTALDTMAFEPSTIDVSAGETVTLEITNSGDTAHEFTLGDTAMQQEHADAMAHLPDGMPHDLPNSVRLQPGETKELTWRFGHAGTLEYACHEPGHYEAGMRGQLTVS
jgi:uncharacterized cupredoxin-like copper-binding protein